MRSGSPFRTGVFVAALVAVAAPAQGFDETPLSARTLPAGHWAVTGLAGFPYVTVNATVAPTDGFDVSLQLRSAWTNHQRAGLATRIKLSSDADSALALRLGVNARFPIGQPTPPRWELVTGEYDATGAAGLVWSWVTRRGTVMSLIGDVLVLGNTKAETVPLGGKPPFMRFGVNGALRVAAEIPYENGLLLAFDLGLDIHTSAFDDGVLMPVFGLGIGYIR